MGKHKGRGMKHTVRINTHYRKTHPNNCPVIETTGDGVPVGVCAFYMTDGFCPRHGKLDDYGKDVKEVLG